MTCRWIIALTLITSLSSTSCTSTSHIGNPLTLPGRAIINSVENAAYNARRGKLEDYINTHSAQIYRDIKTGDGLAIRQAMILARVPEGRQADLLSELSAHPDIYGGEDIEPIIVAIMVHSN